MSALGMSYSSGTPTRYSVARPNGHGRRRLRGVSFRSMRTRSPVLQIDFGRQLRVWGIRWKLKDLDRSVTVEWTSRFRRTLGRAHLERRVVRLSAKLGKPPH